MIDWDFIISGTIIIALILGFWAKISGQTIPELIKSIMEIITDRGEETVEYAEEVIAHD